MVLNTFSSCTPVDYLLHWTVGLKGASPTPSPGTCEPFPHSPSFPAPDTALHKAALSPSSCPSAPIWPLSFLGADPISLCSTRTFLLHLSGRSPSPALPLAAHGPPQSGGDGEDGRVPTAQPWQPPASWGPAVRVPLERGAGTAPQSPLELRGLGGPLSSGTTWLHWPLSLPCASQAVSLGVHPRGLPSNPKSNPKSNPTRREPCGRGGEAPRTCLCSLRPKPAAASEPWPAGCAGLRVTHIPAPRERNSPQHGRIHFLSCSQRPWQSSGRVGSALLPIHVERGPKTLCPNRAWPLLGCKGGGSDRQHWA